MKLDKRLRYGFTIIEILVVIAVIGILVAITAVSYNGLSSRAVASSLQSDLVNASDYLRIDKAQSSTGVFPATLAAANGGTGVKVSSGTTFTYTVNNTNTPKTFCVTATKSGQSYNINQEGIPFAGPCPVLWLDAGITTSYPGTGTTWNDLSGNGNNGTLVNGVVYNSANGGVLDFSGTNRYVSTPYIAQYNIRNAITISVWIKRTTGFSQLADVMILARPSAWYFYDAYNSGSMQADVFIDGVRRGSRTATVPFDGNWYQITYTYDSNTHISSMYKNGVLSSSVALTGLSNYLIDSSTAALTSMGNCGTSGRGMMLNGALIYDHALSADEISKNFNALHNRYGI